VSRALHAQGARHIALPLMRGVRRRSVPERPAQTWPNRLRIGALRTACLLMAILSGISMIVLVVSVVMELDGPSQSTGSSLAFGVMGLGLLSLMMAIGIKGFRIRNVEDLQRESQVRSSLKATVERWLNGNSKTPPNTSLERGRER